MAVAEREKKYFGWWTIIKIWVLVQKKNEKLSPWVNLIGRAKMNDSVI